MPLGIDDDHEAPLRRAVDHAAHFLPSQPPISSFIHHNTLHAFEDLPFEEAVVRAGELFGCEPFLDAAAYRAAIAEGRIASGEISSVVREHLAASAATPILPGVTAAELLELLLAHGIPMVAGHQLTWLLAEGDATARLRRDLPVSTRAQLLRLTAAAPASEGEVAPELWRTARAWARGATPNGPAPRPVRLRDLLLSATGVDTDELTHPLLIRLSGAFLDQGVGHWAMPAKEEGFHRAVTSVYTRTSRFSAAPWMRRFGALLADDRAQGRTEWGSLAHSLASLGVREDEWTDFLAASALALRGWAGMFRQLERQPEQAPVMAPEATLAGFLAVRLLIERATSEHVVSEHLQRGEPLRLVRARLSAGWSEQRHRTLDERAWPLFHALQLAGIRPEAAARVPDEQRAALVRFLERHGDTELRRLLHEAYERTFFERALGALRAHQSTASPEHPAAQVVCCFDEREESFRRHIEELDGSIETFGYAGFFGIAMRFRGFDDAHSRPLCPPGTAPRHEVVEVAAQPMEAHVSIRRRLYRRLARRRPTVTGHDGTTLVRGSLVTAVVGLGSALPLLVRTLVPGLHGRVDQLGRRLTRPRPATALALLRPDAQAHEKRAHTGFSVAEMAGIVERVLEEIGLLERFAPVVLVLGHGSTSLNNPHESAHDCGACGGSRGGPNARSFAAMANHAAVRRELAARGLEIPGGTWFVGGEHNTCNDGVDLFDVDAVPAALSASLQRLRAVLEQARARNAHERARRYASVPQGFSESRALAHMVARARDLAQPRPEYGHATNALCIIGPRAATRGLFLDRRAFLISYDPVEDHDGTVLERLTAAAIPVAAGISLEYYFSFVDPTGYGCGTKLPHNISGLLGVMDGHASDLRTGLPWQMVEIHEPMRLLVVIDAPHARVLKLLDANDNIRRLVRNRWIYVVSRDPATGEMAAVDGERLRPLTPAATHLPRRESSRGWYSGSREHLEFAGIAGEQAS